MMTEQELYDDPAYAAWLEEQYYLTQECRE